VNANGAFASLPLMFRLNLRRRPTIVFVAALLTLTAVRSPADALSRRTEIDFFRDIPSRNLKGFASRSDGRLVAGPVLTELPGPASADILWALAPGADATHWLIGTGPEGRIFETTLEADATKATTRELIKLDESHVFALARLADGSILAGTSPRGALCLVRDGKQVARLALPVDSIFDVLLLDEKTALVATGNPGRLYRIDFATFSAGGVTAEKISDAKQLAERGVTTFGEIRDRNVRRVVRLADGRIAAGSSPKGNVYAFPREGGTPVFLQENRDAEVTDLLPQPDGGLYASIVFSNATGESRLTPAKKEGENLPPAPPEKFAGRSSLFWFPANGFPELLTSRTGIAFYRLAKHDDTIVVAAGELGELIGYNLKARYSLTFSGSISSQLNAVIPLPVAAGKVAGSGKFLLLRNNSTGLAVLDFNATATREAETRRLDLGSPALLGALRFNRMREVGENQLSVDVKVSSGSDEVEGWTPWTPLTPADSAWQTPGVRGRYFKLRFRSTSPAASLEIDRGSLFSLPQNHRPVLQEFRVLSPNFSLLVQPETPAPAVVSLNQVIQKEEDRPRRSNLLNSQVVPSPGMQVVLWTVTDADGDSLAATFSVRREGTETWTDIVVNTRDAFAQFDTAHLPDGIYFTRVVATEIEPRPAGERLSATFETDDLVIDHQRPELLECTAKRVGDKVVITVHGRDALSLLDGIEAQFNNGVHETLEQPVDGIRDGREETFTMEIPQARVTNATSVEVSLYDTAGNGATKRLTW
jgi:hypothetical protein